MGPAPSKGVWVSTTPVLSLSKDATRPSQRQRPSLPSLSLATCVVATSCSWAAWMSSMSLGRRGQTVGHISGDTLRGDDNRSRQPAQGHQRLCICYNTPSLLTTHRGTVRETSPHPLHPPLLAFPLEGKRTSALPLEGESESGGAIEMFMQGAFKHEQNPQCIVPEEAREKACPARGHDLAGPAWTHGLAFR